MMFVLVGLDKDLLEAIGKSVIGIFDPNLSGSVWGVPVIGSDEQWPSYRDAHPNVRAILGIDPPALRERLADFYGRTLLAGYVSDRAYISPRARLGHAVVVQQNVYISGDVAISDGVRVNVGAQIHHDCHIGKFTTIAPTAALMGSVLVGANAYIGAGAVVLQGISIGDGVRVGAGAVVTKPVPAGQTIVGIPARQRVRVE